MKARVVKHGDMYTVERRRGWGLLGWWQLYQITNSLDQACVHFDQLKQLISAVEAYEPKPILVHY